MKLTKLEKLERRYNRGHISHAKYQWELRKLERRSDAWFYAVLFVTWFTVSSSVMILTEWFIKSL